MPSVLQWWHRLELRSRLWLSLRLEEVTAWAAAPHAQPVQGKLRGADSQTKPRYFGHELITITGSKLVWHYCESPKAYPTTMTSQNQLKLAIKLQLTLAPQKAWDGTTHLIHNDSLDTKHCLLAYAVCIAVLFPVSEQHKVSSLCRCHHAHVGEEHLSRHYTSCTERWMQEVLSSDCYTLLPLLTGLRQLPSPLWDSTISGLWAMQYTMFFHKH